MWRFWRRWRIGRSTDALSVCDALDEADDLDCDEESGSADCPCCGLPTLFARGECDICTICWWEDDGTDDPDDRLTPNHGYSLREAQANFRNHGDMYDPDDGSPISTYMTAERARLLEYVWAGEIDEDRLRILKRDLDDPNGASDSRASVPRARRPLGPRARRSFGPRDDVFSIDHPTHTRPYDAWDPPAPPKSSPR
ncbi:MAG: CPCC family cysteine-rich protein [Pseudomonadota bacterium]